MIVVIGAPRLRGAGPDAGAVGLAVSIARAAAADGSTVEFVGKIGDDPAGDALMLSFARGRIGHVAMLRDPAGATILVAGPDDDPIDADQPVDPPPPGGGSIDDGPPLDAADAGLALRYLPEIRVIVTVHADPAVLGEAVAASGWTDTALLVVVPADAANPGGLPAGALSLAIADDDESMVGAAIGRYAAALDRGEPAESAYASLIAAGSSEVTA